MESNFESRTLGDPVADTVFQLPVRHSGGRTGGFQAPQETSIADMNLDLEGIHRFDEDLDDHELFVSVYNLITKGADKLKASDLKNYVDGYSEKNELLIALQKALVERKLGDDIDFATFERLCADTPRACGRRLQWVQSLHLDRAFARLLPIGDLSDELKGIRGISAATLSSILGSFTALLPGLVAAALARLHAEAPPALGSQSDGEEDLLGSKFSAAGAHTGSFATLDDFYRGPEAVLGTPNPRVFEGMEREHCHRANSQARPTSPPRPADMLCKRV